MSALAARQREFIEAIFGEGEPAPALGVYRRHVLANLRGAWREIALSARGVLAGALRPDLPAWLEAALGRATAPDPGRRFDDMVEFALTMEAGPARVAPEIRRPRTLYERAPLQVWQGIAGLLALALLASWLVR